MKKALVKKSGKFTVQHNKTQVKKMSSEHSGSSYKNLFYGALTVLLVIAIGLGIFRIYSVNKKGDIANEGLEVSSQEENNQTVENTEPTKEISDTGTYTVAEGDTLWKISEKYYKDGYKWVEIAKANKLENPSLIFKGTKLTIPKVEPTAQVAASSKDNQTTISQNNKIEGKEYTVQKGDYLWKISLLAYGDGYKWTEIAKANKLENPSLIHSGNKFVIPR